MLTTAERVAISWGRKQPHAARCLKGSGLGRKERALSVRYESWTDPVEPVVSPLGLALKAGAWYIVAVLDAEPRTYRISNIRSATCLKTRVERPSKFALPADRCGRGLN